MTLPTFLRTLVAAAVMLSSGCATASNYTDPSGPVLTGAHARSRPASDVLRVVTWNLKFGEHVDRAAIQLSQPGPLNNADVLVVQEMDEPGMAALSRALGMNYVYVPSAIHGSSHRDFGVGILSPWPLEHASKIILPHHHRFRKLRRAAAVVTVLSPMGPLRVYGVHLETPLGAWSWHRRDQARAVLADAAGWAGAVIVAGDFNGRAGAEEIADAGFQWVTRHVHDRAWFFDFDHILIRGLCSPDGQEAAGQARDVTHASDHRAVWALVRSCQERRP